MEEEYKFICEEDKEKVINVLENKKALLSQWIDTINEFESDFVVSKFGILE